MSSNAPPSSTGLQDRIVRLLGNSVEGRSPLIAGMLRRDVNEATSYWLQLVVAIGIATLGLVVGSTAVVIGAMLVAPLMRPIVGLAMGLAAGSPFLVLRSAGRIAMSMAVAIGGAAVITRLLPYHELNAEISGRTSPTVLDLVTASFCALAGVYATLRPCSDTVATAAGTSIGISLVPPLCASGYGLGAASWPVAQGAALLFVTNLVAIVAVGTVSFLAAGFNRVNVIALERDEFGRNSNTGRIARALAARLARLFESRAGPVFRFLTPLVLLAVVYVPLRRALDEVTWEVRVRAAVRAAVAREPAHVVQSRVRIERHEINIVVVLLGSTNDAIVARAHMEASIRAASDVAPHIEVFAIPDAAAFAGLESTLLTPHEIKPAAPPSLSPDEQLTLARARIRDVVQTVWPTSTAGAPLTIDVDTAQTNATRVRVVHLGTALSADAAETVRRAIASGLEREIALVDVAVPRTPCHVRRATPPSPLQSPQEFARRSILRACRFAS